jgi:hypothetical protein
MKKNVLFKDVCLIKNDLQNALIGYKHFMNLGPKILV